MPSLRYPVAIRTGRGGVARHGDGPESQPLRAGKHDIAGRIPQESVGRESTGRRIDLDCETDDRRFGLRRDWGRHRKEKRDRTASRAKGHPAKACCARAHVGASLRVFMVIAGLAG